MEIRESCMQNTHAYKLRQLFQLMVFHRSLTCRHHNGICCSLPMQWGLLDWGLRRRRAERLHLPRPQLTVSGSSQGWHSTWGHPGRPQCPRLHSVWTEWGGWCMEKWQLHIQPVRQKWLQSSIRHWKLLELMIQNVYVDTLINKRLQGIHVFVVTLPSDKKASSTHVNSQCTEYMHKPCLLIWHL